MKVSKSGHDRLTDSHQKYINEEIAKVLVLHADHYQQFKDGDHLKRLVGLMHRIGVKRQAEGIFFKVSCL